jgi:lipopolysaccharide heptosyltransferase III
MSRLVELSRSARMRRLGRALDRSARRVLDAVLDVVWPPGANGQLPDAETVRSILLVRPNFRIGNTVLATALIPVLQARFPAASIDYLAGDTTAKLLDGLPIHRVHCISRSFLLAPWRFIALFFLLRRQQFDLAIDGGLGSLSGALYAYLSNARQRLGGAGRSSRFLTVRLQLPPVGNAYETAANLARAFGVDVPAWPSYRVSAAEAAVAFPLLRDLGLTVGDDVRPFVAAFVGGHQNKPWPRDHWLELIGQLDAEGTPAVVFVGPEETNFVAALQMQARRSVRVVPPQALRTFASLLARATLLVTPDSGPMHLAAALGVPVVALIQTDGSRFYAPPGRENRVLWRPTSAEARAALHAHPRWALLTPHRSGEPLDSSRRFSSISGSTG